jgi:hypothetical protein
MFAFSDPDQQHCFRQIRIGHLSTSKTLLLMPLADDKAATSEAAVVVDGSAESGDNAAVYSDDGDDDDMDTYVPGTRKGREGKDRQKLELYR